MKVEKLMEGSKWLKNENSSETFPKITVILPIRNSLSALSFESIESILSQTEVAIELIVVHDGADIAMINAIQKNHRVHFIVHSHKIDTFSVSLYEAYLKAHAEWILFAEEGFIFSKNSFAQMYNVLREGIHWVTVGIAHELFPDDTVRVFGDKQLTHLISQNMFSSSAILINRSVFETIGWFDPHPLMKDFCKWDLWLRIASRYPIKQTSILVGKKKVTSHEACTQSEYCARIIMNLDRQETLSIKNFQNLEIFRDFPEAIQAKLSPYIEEIKNPKKIRRKICILSPKEPSPFYPFFALNETEVFEVIFMDLAAAVRSEELMSADLVIINRYLLFYTSIIPKLNALSIPWGYFIDDNFTVLAKEGYAQFEWYTHDHLRQHLSTAKIVFTSTEALKQYYTLHHLHDTLHILQPVMSHSLLQRSAFIRPHKTDIKPMHIAMVGGDFRYPNFTNIVLPALIQLSMQIDIVLWSTSSIPESVVLPEVMTVHKLPMQPDYEQFILHLSSLSIDCIVHPHGRTKDIPYKTDAILLMARYLQANIIVGDEPCFDSITEMCGVFKVENTSEGFYAAFVRLMDQKTKKIQLARMVQYSEEHYSIANNQAVLEKILRDIPLASIFMIEHRTVRMGNLFFNQNLPKTKLVRMVEVFQEKGFKWLLRAGVNQIKSIFCLKPRQ